MIPNENLEQIGNKTEDPPWLLVTGTDALVPYSILICTIQFICSDLTIESFNY